MGVTQYVPKFANDLPLALAHRLLRDFQLPGELFF
jgi:hypothetical protein